MEKNPREPGKTQKQIQSEQTRRRIVAAAAELFVSKGFEGSSIADLARATKLTKGRFIITSRARASCSSP